MGIVCAEAPPQLAHKDDISGRQADSSRSSVAGAMVPTLEVSLPSDHALPNDGHNVKSKPSPSNNRPINSASTKTIKKQSKSTKKSVRINDQVTLIPLLTSASFFRKTPKPTTITSSGFGIMPSFRIVTPSAVASSSTDRSSLDHDTNSDDSSKDGLVPKESLWWTKEERREILQANQKASRDFKRFQPTKIRQANMVYNEIVMDCCSRKDGQPHDDEENYDDNDIYDFFQRKHLMARIETTTSCSKSSTSATTSTSSRHASTNKRKRSDFAPTFAEDSCDLPPPTLPEDTIDLPTTVRGLEWGIMPDAKRFRKAHARTVLGWQQRFRAMKTNRHRRRRNGHDCDRESSQEEDWMLSSSSSSSSDDDDDERISFQGKRKQSDISRQQKDQEDLLLGQKASISSLRSCILARVFGKSDEIAANITASTTSELEKNRSKTLSPTPSLMGTTDESASSDSDEDRDSSGSDAEDSDHESDSESDSDGEDDDQSKSKIFSTGCYRASSLSMVNHRPSPTTNSHRRMFRPRMMPPMSWR